MKDDKWWGDITFSDQQILSWNIGQRSIIIQRNVDEWNCWNLESESEIDQPIIQKPLLCAVPSIESETLEAGGNCFSPSEKMFGRYLEHGSNGAVRVLPLLADRSVVARPATPLTLLAGEKSKLFVSTPIWFSAMTLPDNQRFLDLPFWRPSDSWFGSSTIEGELCYAKYTSARVQLANLEKRSHRAITPITVTNNQENPLVIERLNVPVNLLHLYAERDEDDQAQFWTSEIAIQTDKHSNNVEVDIKDTSPKEAIYESNSERSVVEFELVSPPRIKIEQNKLIRNISNLLG